MSVPVKVAVAEASVIIRQGVLSVLKQMGTLHLDVYEISDVENLESALSWQKPDVLIVNPSLLGVLGLQKLRKKLDSKQLKCVAIQSVMINATALREYDEVISIYDSTEQIADKFQRLARASKEEDKRHESLSQREREVIVGIVKGFTNKQIAEALHLSAHTVMTHRKNIAAKLQIHSTAGLTIYAIVNKLVELSDIQVSNNE